jgi:thiol peroxidase
MGNPLTLVGEEVKAGSKASAFSVLEKDLGEVKLADFSGKASR